MKNFAMIDRSLSRVRPLWYLVAYLVAIPFFGFVYAFGAPHEFYAPYAHREPSAVADKEVLQDTLTTALQKAISKSPADNLTVGEWHVDPKSVVVILADSADGSELSFTVRFEANIADPVSGDGQMVGPLFLKISKQSNRTVDELGTTTFFRLLELRNGVPATVLHPSSQAFMEAIFKPPSNTGYLAPVLVLNGTEEEKVINYLQGVEGDASSFSGHFWRMTYLSAVVITTLGLGDIIPISQKSRALVATEAVLGIILAGLFLNALAYQVSKRDTGGPSSP